MLTSTIQIGVLPIVFSQRTAVVFALLACFVACRCGGAEPASEPSDYETRRDQLDEAHRQRLASLAALCRQLNLAEQAEATANWFPPRDPRRQYLFLPPPVDALKPADDAPTIVQQWYARFQRDRKVMADELFQLARRELECDRPTRAYQLLHEVLHEDPDHEAARQALGYRRVDGRWAKPTSTIRSRQVRTGNPTLGIARGPYWAIDSENFSIATSHSEQAGRQLAERLETLHAVWEQVFFRYWSNAAALSRRFEAQGGLPRSGARHRVVLFRDRDEYLSYLKPLEPRIELTVGIYMDKKKAAYFYVEGQTDEAVFYHEVTHQLFSETGRVAAEIGEGGNFWIVEGVAMYMESLRSLNGYCTVGGVDASRLQYARYRKLNDQFYIPLDQLVSLGRRALQEHPDIRLLYSQSAGLAAMLMDDRRGAHREALVDYLQAVYAGRDRPDTLAALLDQPLSALDSEYPRFLDVTDDDLAYLAAMPWARELSLGHTSITDAGLKKLSDHTHLVWLDLGFTQTTDAGFVNLRQATGINHLIIERTRITDESLKIIGTFRELEILDVTGTAITDEGLKHLATLPNLRELWIGNTSVSDAGLEHLRGLKKLEIVDVGGTRVTAEGWKRLRAALPSLQE